MPIISDNTQLI